MPTGYTADIANDITFEKFLFSCARAFGALIMMRDDPADAPIPEKFEPASHYFDWLRDAKNELARLEWLTPDQAALEAAAAYDKAAADNDRYRADKAALRVKYEAMREKARAWTPPTPDHQGLKDFMIKQITESIEFDCTSYMDAPKRLDGPTWLAEQIRSTRNRVTRYQDELDKEIERARVRTEWVQALRASVNGSAAQNEVSK
jgi:hypothetical protein